MKGCELCRDAARMYCESDGASLCWDCDAKVHSANFLVAKHSRCLLCHVCQSVTPWIASGTNLGRTISVCVTCHHNRHNAAAQTETSSHDRGIGEDEQLTLTDSEGEYSSDSNYDEDKDEDGENQVVPWSCSPSPPPTAISLSSHEDLSLSMLSSASGGVSSLKRRRQDTHLSSEDDTITGCSSSTCQGEDETPEIMSSPASQGYEEASTSLGSPRPLRNYVNWFTVACEGRQIKGV